MENKMKNGFILFAGMLATFLGLPMWFYLLYKILEAVNASDLMWFIFWCYIPVTVIISIAGRIAESMKGD